MAALISGARHTAVPTSRHVLSVAVQSALLTLLSTALPSASAADVTATTTEAALGEIVVKAQRDDSGNTRNGASVVLSAEQIGQQHIIDLSNLARSAPLISVPGAASGSGNIWDGAGNTGINIRGVEGNRVSMEVDGVALPDAAPKPDANSANSFGIGRDYFDPETFRAIRVGSGTSPAGAGTPGIGGAVSFVTKAPEDYLTGRNLYADYKVGYTAERHATMHAVTAAAVLGAQLNGLIVGVHRSGDQGTSRGSVALNPDEWNSDAVLAKLNWKLARDQHLVFSIDHYQSTHERKFVNKLGPSYPEGASQNSHTERTRYSIEHLYTPAAGGWFDTLTTRLYTQNAAVTDLTRANYLSANQPTLRNIDTGFYNSSKGLALDATRQLNPDSLLSYGLSYEQQQARRPWREDRTIIKTGAHQITMKNRMADMDTDQLAAYLRGEFDFTLLGHSATLTPGLRGEQRKLTPNNLASYLIAVPSAARELKPVTDSFFTPSLNLSLELAPGLSTYAQYSRGTRLPSVAERTGTYDSFTYTAAGNAYAVLGNPQLKKETSNAFELGVKGAPAQGVELSAALFHTRYSNLIEYAAQPLDPLNYPTITFGLYRPENIGHATIKGVEVSSRWQLGQWLPALRGGSVALAVGASQGKAENRRTGKQADLPTVQPYKANLNFAYDDPAQRGGVAFAVSSVRGKQAADDVIADASGARFAVPGSTVMDFTAYWNLSKHAVLNAGIYNLADKKYWDYASARSLPAGTSVTTLADIERYVRPGRNVALTLNVIY